MNDTPIIGLGAGGHAAVVIDILRMARRWRFVRLLDANPRNRGTRVAGVPVIGDDSELTELRYQGIDHAFIGVGITPHTHVRRRLYCLLLDHDFTVASAIHPQSAISSTATLGPGLTVMAQAAINTGASLGANVVVNTGAIIEHDCVVEDHAFIAPGAVLTGAVHVEAGAVIGAGATVLPGVRIGAGSLIAAGAVVRADVEANVMVAGVPAQAKRRLDAAPVKPALRIHTAPDDPDTELDPAIIEDPATQGKRRSA